MVPLKSTIVCLFAACLFALPSCSPSHVPGEKTSSSNASVGRESAFADRSDASDQPRGDTSGIPSDVTELFSLHGGWKAVSHGSATDVILPSSLMTNAEDSPMQFYWMRAVALSKESGFALADHLGNAATLEVYAIRHGAIPDDFSDADFGEPRGIVIRDKEGAIIGAFIDIGRHTGNAYTLDLKTFEEATGLSLGDYWHTYYYDQTDPVNIAAEKRTPEEVISLYFNSMASGDIKKQRSTVCLRQKLNSIFVNMENTWPYNKEARLYSYLTAVKILSINPYPGDTDEPKTYEVLIDAMLSEKGRQVLGHDGEMGRYLSIGNENGRLCVFEDGTGP